MAIDLCLTTKCNNNCLMCSNPDYEWPAYDGSYDYSFEAIIKRLEKKRNEILASDCIYVTGGEPTTHSRFLDILTYLQENFPKQKIKLLTNGRRFYYSDFAEQVLDLVDDLEVEFSLYGPDSQTHDAVTRSRGSFDQTLQGGRNLLRISKGRCPVSVRFVVTGLTYKYIKETLETIKNNLAEVKSVMIMFMEFEGKALKNLDQVRATYSETAPYLQKAKEEFNDLREVRLYHFPLCQVDSELWPYCWNTWPAEEITYLKTCEECAYKKHCVGIHKNYLEYVGADEFCALQGDTSIVETGNKFHPISQVKK